MCLARAVVLLLLAGCAPEPAAIADDAAGTQMQWRLGSNLREISGLALTSDDRLFAVTDERAVVYEIDYESGRLVKAFAAGDPVLSGDFEGIATLDQRIWLMDSRGTLVAMEEGEDGEHVDYVRFDTGVQDECEFEGLAADESTGTLFLLCKESYKKKAGLRIFAFKVSGTGIDPLAEVELDEEAFHDAIDERAPRFSGLEFDRRDGSLIAVAARERIIVRLTGAGDLLAVIMKLDKKNHRQAEGVALTRDGRLLIADEGGSGRARLTVYRLQ